MPSLRNKGTQADGVQVGATPPMAATPQAGTTPSVAATPQAATPTATTPPAAATPTVATPTATTPQAPRPQTWGRVFVLEFRRIILRMPTLMAIGIFALIAIGMVSGAMSAMEWAKNAAAGDSIGEVQFIGFGTAVSPLSFLLGLLCVSSSARDYADGAAAATVVAVPRRGRLLTARIAVWALTSFAVTLVALLIVMLMYMSYMGNIAQALMSVVCGALGTSVLVLVAFACATAVRRGALAMLAFLGIDFIIPSGLSLAGVFVPSFLQSALDVLVRILPGNAVGTFADASKIYSGATGDWVFGAVATLAWAVLSVVVSYVTFTRYAGASD